MGLDVKRPSDRCGHVKKRWPQCAFKILMLVVSCNSHWFSQLAAFFIDWRAE